jgi:hypothetical protein
MKRKLAILAYLIVSSGVAYAVTKQAQQLGNVALPSYTAAQISTLTGNTTGQIVYCSNCTTNGGKGTVCISTGAFANSFVLSTGTVCQ